MRDFFNYFKICFFFFEAKPKTGKNSVGGGTMVVNARVCTHVCVCTGIKDQAMRELDSKLVVIDLVTVHRVHVHVGRLLRVLQGVILSLSLCLFPCLSASLPSSRSLPLSPNLSLSLSPSLPLSALLCALT